MQLAYLILYLRLNYIKWTCRVVYGHITEWSRKQKIEIECNGRFDFDKIIVLERVFEYSTKTWSNAEKVLKFNNNAKTHTKEVDIISKKKTMIQYMSTASPVNYYQIFEYTRSYSSHKFVAVSFMLHIESSLGEREVQQFDNDASEFTLFFLLTSYFLLLIYIYTKPLSKYKAISYIRGETNVQCGVSKGANGLRGCVYIRRRKNIKPAVIVPFVDNKKKQFKPLCVPQVLPPYL